MSDVKTEWVVENAKDTSQGKPYAHAVLYNGVDPYGHKDKDYYLSQGYDVLSDEEFDEYVQSVEKSMCGHWSEITKEEYYDALDVLPPVDYKDGGFYISETTTGSVHSFYQKINDKFYTCYQQIGTPRSEITDSLKKYISSHKCTHSLEY